MSNSAKISKEHKMSNIQILDIPLTEIIDLSLETTDNICGGHGYEKKAYGYKKEEHGYEKEGYEYEKEGYGYEKKAYGYEKKAYGYGY
jgi:hypothetical protein